MMNFNGFNANRYNPFMDSARQAVEANRYQQPQPLYAPQRPFYPPISQPPAYQQQDQFAGSFGMMMQSMMGMIVTLLQSLLSSGLGQTQQGYDQPQYEAPKTETPKYDTPVVNDNNCGIPESQKDEPKYEAPKPEAPKYEPPKEEPPKYDPPKPPVYEPPAPTPDPYTPPKKQLLGAAGLNGDPKFSLYTPSLRDKTELSALKDFESGLKVGDNESLLKDADKGGFEVDITGVQVNPEEANSVGVADATFKVGDQTVIFKSNGDLVIDGKVEGNINNAGTISEITLKNGAKVSTADRIDDAAGNKKERFVISNGEYEVTAAVRSPHVDAENYLDMNFAELVANAADNATGYQTTVTGFGNKKMGIADLLKLEA